MMLCAESPTTILLEFGAPLALSFLINIFLLIRLYSARKIINGVAELTSGVVATSEVISQRLKEIAASGDK